MAAFDDLIAEVEETKSVNQSVLKLVRGLKERLEQAGTDPAKLRAVIADLDAQNKEMAEAVVANTPGEEPTEPTDPNA